VSRIGAGRGTITRVRVLSTAAALAALALAVPAEAAQPLGAPESVRLARAADAHSRPAASTQWWQLAAVDPRSRAALRIRLWGGLTPRGVDVAVTPLRWSGRLGEHLVAHGRRWPTWSGVDGTSALRRAGRRWRITMSGPRVSGRLTLTRPRRGPAGLRWRLGAEPRQRGFEPVALSWSALAATSRLRGGLTVDGVPVRFDGWRASLEHVWGRFTLIDRAWEYGNSFIVHRRGGGAALAFGVNRTDTVTGPGARDGQWLGVLARVGRRRTRVCRPTVRRRDWAPTSIGWMPYARQLRARCGNLRIAFRAREPVRHLWGGTGVGHYEHAWSASATGGGPGIGWAFGHDTLP